MDARTAAHMYATLKSEWKALEEVRKFIITGPLADLLDDEIAITRANLVKFGKKLEKTAIKEAEL